STRSVTTTSTAPPIYTAGNPGDATTRPHHVQYPRPGSSSSTTTRGLNPRDPSATTDGPLRTLTSQEDGAGDPRFPNVVVGNFSPTGSILGADTASIAHCSMAASDAKTDIIGFNRGAERNITNCINIARKATPHHRIFSLFYPN